MRQKQTGVAFAYESRGPRDRGIHRDGHDHWHPGGDRDPARRSDRTCQKSKGLGSGERAVGTYYGGGVGADSGGGRLTQASSRPRQQFNSHGKHHALCGTYLCYLVVHAVSWTLTDTRLAYLP